MLQKPEPEIELYEDSLLGKLETGQGDKKPESCVSRLCVVTSKVREAGMAEYLGEINPC